MVSQKRQARNSSFATPLAPSVAHPYVVAGTKSTTFSRLWYRDITVVTRSAAIVGRNVEECVQKRKKRGNTTADARTYTQTRQVTEVSRATMIKCGTKTEERVLKLGIF